MERVELPTSPIFIGLVACIVTATKNETRQQLLMNVPVKFAPFFGKSLGTLFNLFVLFGFCTTCCQQKNKRYK